jgi:hypothetical protein
MQRIATAELSVYRRRLLMECVEAYLPLEGPHLQQFRDLLLTKDFREAQMLAKTSFEMGVEKGMEQERRAYVRRLLETRFGTLSETATQRLAAMSFEKLQDLGTDIVLGKSLVEMGLEDAPANPSTNGV